MAEGSSEWRDLLNTKPRTMKQLVRYLEMANISRIVALHKAGIVEQ